jgi:hypothetical protein
MHAISAFIPLEADDFEQRFTVDAADLISQEFPTVEYTVTDDDHYLGQIVEFRGDAAELVEMIQDHLGLEVQEAIVWSA